MPPASRGSESHLARWTHSLAWKQPSPAKRMIGGPNPPASAYYLSSKERDGKKAFCLDTLCLFSLSLLFNNTKGYSYLSLIKNSILTKITKVYVSKSEIDLFFGYFSFLIPVCTLAFRADIGIFFLIAWYPGMPASFALVSFECYFCHSIELYY
jgi:hypothetical protein